MQNQGIWQIHFGRTFEGIIIAPAAYGCKAPGVQALQRSIRPGSRIGILTEGSICGPCRVVFQPGFAGSYAADARGEERMARRRDEPPRSRSVFDLERRRW